MRRGRTFVMTRAWWVAGGALLVAAVMAAIALTSPMGAPLTTSPTDTAATDAAATEATPTGAASSSASPPASSPTPTAPCVVTDVTLGASTQGDAEFIRTGYYVTAEGEDLPEQVELTENVPKQALSVSGLPAGVREAAVLAALDEPAEERGYRRSFDDVEAGGDSPEDFVVPGRVLTYVWLVPVTAPFSFTCGDVNGAGVLHAYDMLLGEGVVHCDGTADEDDEIETAARRLAESLGQDCSPKATAKD
jgi:hypothetical protein